MSQDGQPDLVTPFIHAHISSVAQLEILLLLHTNPSQAWSVAAIARELRIEQAGAKVQLLALESSGLIKADPLPAAPPDSPPVYRFAPQAPELQAATVALAQAYLIRRVSIIGLIFNKPSDKIRAFSDAFRLRKDPPLG